jgi:hypothetical protein
MPSTQQLKRRPDAAQRRGYNRLQNARRGIMKNTNRRDATARVSTQATHEQNRVSAKARRAQTGKFGQEELKMRVKTQPQEISRITEIEIGLGESVVVHVEAGQAKGYLIAEAFTVGELPSEITLSKVFYVCAQDEKVQVAEIAEVLVTGKNDYWFATDTATISIIPCPSSQPYPVLFISKYGFNWMKQAIRDSAFQRLLDHLGRRFDHSDFATDRKLLSDPDSPFSRASCFVGFTQNMND